MCVEERGSSFGSQPLFAVGRLSHRQEMLGVVRRGRGGASAATAADGDVFESFGAEGGADDLGAVDGWVVNTGNGLKR